MNDSKNPLATFSQQEDDKALVERVFSLSKTQKSKDLQAFSGTMPMLQKGHSGQVNDVAWSHDGKYIYTAGGDNAIKKWDFASGRLLRTFQGHTGAVNGIAVSADGQLVASGSSDNKVIIWNPMGDILRVFVGHRNQVESVDFTPDGRYVVSGGWDNGIRLWPIEGDSSPQVFKGHTENISMVLVSPNGRFIVSASWDHTVKIWDFDGHIRYSLDHSSDQVRRRLKYFDYASNVWSLSVNSDNTLIAAGLYNGNVAVWDFKGNLVCTFKAFQEDRVDGLCFDNTGKFLAIGFGPSPNKKACIKIWRTDNWTETTALSDIDGPTDAVRGLAFRNNTLISASWDGSVKIWDLSLTPFQVRSCHSYKKNIASVAVTNDGCRIAVAVGDTLRIFDITGNKKHCFKEDGQSFRLCTFSRDGRFIAAGTWGHGVKVYDLIKNEKEGEYIGHSDNVNDIRFSSDNNHFISASGKYQERGEMFLWSIGRYRTYIPIGYHRCKVYGAAFSRDERLLVSRSSDKTIKIWDLVDNTLHANIGFNPCWCKNLSLSPDDRHICAGGTRYILNIISPAPCMFGAAPENGKIISIDTKHIDDIWSIAISSDGQLLATGGDDQYIRIYSREGLLVNSFQVRKGEVRCLSFSPDKQLLAASLYLGVREAGEIQIWNLDNETSKSIRISETAMSVAFDPSGKMIICNPLEIQCIMLDGKIKFSKTDPNKSRGSGSYALASSLGGEFFATDSSKGFITLWDYSGNIIKVFKAQNEAVNSLAFSSDGKYLASGSSDGTVCIFSVLGSSSKALYILETDFYRINEIRFLPENNAVIFRAEYSGSGNYGKNRSLLMKWYITKPVADAVNVGELRLARIAMPSDGSYLVMLSYDYPVVLWDLNGNQQKQFLEHTGEATSSVFSSDGKYLFSAGTDKTICHWEVDTGKLIKRLTGHRGRIQDICVTPDGHLLISADSEEIKMWSVEKGELVASWVMLSDEDHAIYTPDNLFYVSDPASIQIYEKMINQEVVPLSDTDQLRKATYRFIDREEIAERILGG